MITLPVFFLSLLTAIAQPPSSKGKAACADAIQIDGEANEVQQLRDVMRSGTLGKPLEQCDGYRVALTQTGQGSWQVTLTRESSQVQLSREVRRLSYAATWIETWLQSGFAASTDESMVDAKDVAAPPASITTAKSPQPTSATADRASLAVARDTGKTPLAPTRAATMRRSFPVFLTLESTLIVTSRGNRLLGGALVVGLPALHTPWYAVEVGGAAQAGPAGREQHRAYWAGPILGMTVPLAERIRLRPAVELGALASTTSKGYSAGLYTGLRGDLEFDLARNFSLAIGLDARIFFDHLLGSAGTTFTQSQSIGETESDDFEEETPETTTTTTSIPAPRLGFLLGAAQAGVVWRFGGAP